MQLVESIKKIAESIPAELNEKDGVYNLSFIVAERKVFLTKKKLEYVAKFRINEKDKEIKFTEMLKESGFGLSTSGGDDDMSPGFGFKKETYKTGVGPREGTIEEQSEFFGKQYSYNFDFKTIRKQIEEIAKNEGYKFQYQITPIGL